MKLKISQIADGFQIINRIGNEKMPIKVSFIIQRNLRLLAPEFTDWEKTRTDLIINKYGTKDDNGNFTVSAENIKAFQDEMTAIGAVEVDLDLQTIPLNDFRLEISPVDLMAIEWMFSEA
jgi:hypothetical protein